MLTVTMAVVASVNVARLTTTGAPGNVLGDFEASLTVHTNIARITIAGTMRDAQLAATGSIGAVVARAIVNSVIRVDDGISRMKAGSLIDSAICAGIAPEELENELYTFSFDRFSVIGAIKIGTFQDSHIGASKIGSVMIQGIVASDGGPGSGIRAYSIDNYDRAGEVHLSDLKPGGVYDQVNNYFVFLPSAT